MEPSDKAPGIASFLDAVTKQNFGKTRTQSITSDSCVFCDIACPPDSFDGELSRKEFSISGMCQACQNDMFGVQVEIAPPVNDNPIPATCENCSHWSQMVAEYSHDRDEILAVCEHPSNKARWMGGKEFCVYYTKIEVR